MFKWSVPYYSGLKGKQLSKCQFTRWAHVLILGLTALS